MSTMPPGTTSAQAQQDPKSREVRLGLVMYGGVSLAIYINGVAQEFFRAVHGRSIYKLIKALTDSDIVVDIISGTSAGGINGIALAYALCNNCDFTSSTNLWRRHGDIRSMLRSPNPGAEAPQSLLDSEGYYQPRLEDAFRYMPVYVPESEGEIESTFDELDLFVTGTDVDGAVATQFDDAGHPIDVKNHRAVFLLKHRLGRREPFNPKSDGDSRANEEVTYRALAKLARITSCFPAAFAPVYVTNGQTEEDRLLQEWGRLHKETSFLDGGILDNKPFTHTLQEIFYRTADRRIDRKLFYVEPDPEHLTERETASRPDVAEAIVASLIGIPGYESISDDLKLLTRHNSKIIQYERMIAALGYADTLDTTSTHVRQLYIPSRLISISDRVVRGLLRVNGRDELLDQETRRAGTALIQAFDKSMRQEAFETPYPRLLSHFDVYFRLRRLFHVTYKIEEQLSEAEDRETIYRQLWCAINQQIKLLGIVKTRMESLIDEAPIEWKSRILDVLDTNGDVVKQAAGVWSTVELAFYKLLYKDSVLAPLLEEWIVQGLAHQGVMPDSQKHLSKINGRLKSLADDVIRDIQEDKLDKLGLLAAEGLETIFRQLDHYEREIIKQILKDETDIVRRAYERFISVDVYLFPLELVADLHEKDVIETIRISPRDAKKGFSNKGLSDKVSGDALYHFGGFFKRSWRSNDILWGRLDGACQLIESLLTQEVLAEIASHAKSGLRDKARQRFFKNPDVPDNQLEWAPGLDPARLFPHAGTQTHEACRTWIIGLLSCDRDKRDAALDRKRLGEKIELLIEAAQLEIIDEEMPNVITDALGEQAQWNQFRLSAADREQLLAAAGRRKAWSMLGDNGTRTGGSSTPDPFTYQAPAGNLDPFVAVIAAAGQAESVMENLKEPHPSAPPRPSQTKLGRFFKKQYEVGTEDLLRDMPRLVLLEILAVSLLVLRNCILGMFGANAAKVKQSPLYLLGVDYPLRVFYNLVLFLRRAPQMWKVLLGGLALVSAIALWVGLTWRHSIIFPGGVFSFTWFIVFIAAPILVLSAESFFLLQRRPSDRAPKQIFRAMFVAGCIALLVMSTLILVAAFIGVESVSHWLQSAIVRRMADYPAPLSSFSPEWQNRIALGVLIVCVSLALFMPYIGGLWLLRRGRQPRTAPRELRSLLEHYFTIDDMEPIARRMAGWEMIETSSLWRILDQYLDIQELPRVGQEIERYEEIEHARAYEVLKDYLPADMLRRIEKKLGVASASDGEQFALGAKSEARAAGDPARLKAVLADYVGDAGQLQALIAALGPVANRSLRTLDRVASTLNQYVDSLQKVAQSRRLVAAGRQQFPRQRKMIAGSLIGYTGLQNLLEEHISVLGLTRVIAEKLGIPRQETAQAPLQGALTADLLQETLTAHLGDLADVRRIIAARLAPAKVVEWSNARRVVEEHLRIHVVVKIIKCRVGPACVIGWNELTAVLADYADPQEVLNVADYFLASRKVVWANRKKIAAILEEALADYTDKRERDMIMKQLRGFKRMTWPDLRALLKNYVSEVEVRAIAANLLAGRRVRWGLIDEALKKQLNVSTIMKIMTYRLTGLPIGCDRLSPPQRTAVAAQIVVYAEQNQILAQLEQQMRTINPEVLA